MAIDEHRRDSWPNRLRGALRVLLGDAGIGTPSGGLPSAIDRARTHPQGPLIEQLIGGLPGPGFVLDREARVIALKDEATPRPSKRREQQRVEFFERVPLDRWFEAFVTPVRLPTGSDADSDCLLMTFNDLTPLRRVEEMRADFVANASHELRTPLAALLGFIETLQGSARDDAGARERFLAIMQGQATRMARLIDDLLSLSRIELNAHLRPNTPVDLGPIVRPGADGLPGA